MNEYNGIEPVFDVNRAAIAKVMCSQSLLFSARYFFKHVNKKKLIVGDPHRIICYHLERVLRGECKRLIINIAPRYGKTEFAVKQFIAHGLALNPAAKFIHLSYSDDLALDNSEAVKDLCQSNEYRELFPDVVVKKDSKAKNKWYTTAGGGVLARSAGGAVTGFGAGQTDGEYTAVDDATLKQLEIEEQNDIDEFIQGIVDAQLSSSHLESKFKFGGAVIIDDALKPEDADSDVKRERINSRMDSTVRNRVNSRDTPIIAIGQRLHPMDLCGYLQRKEDEDEWEVISLPSINMMAIPVPGEKNEDGTQRCLEINAALLPWKHTLAELRKKEKANPLVFGRQHMQDPSPRAGLLFPKQSLHFYNHAEMETLLNDPDFCYVPVDPANLGGDDFAAAPFKLIGNKIYVTGMIYNTSGTDVNELQVRNMCLTERAGECGVEGVMGWRETALRIDKYLQDKDYQGEFRILHTRTNKHSRILNRAAFIINNMYFRDDYEDFPEYAKFMRILTGYMRIQQAGKNNIHDDAPDLCEMAGTYYERNHSHLWG